MKYPYSHLTHMFVVSLLLGVHPRKHRISQTGCEAGSLVEGDSINTSSTTPSLGEEGESHVASAPKLIVGVAKYRCSKWLFTRANFNYI